MDIKKMLWETCAEFHGHECGGLTIGYKAALYVVELMKLQQEATGCVSADEELVCVAENESCSVDAIRVILGCTEDKGNLMFHLTNQQAFTVFNRKTRESIRIVLKARPEGITRENSFAYYQSKEPAELFDVTPVKMDLPERINLNESFTCSCCGETAGSNWIRFVDGKPLCLDCLAEQEETN